jgi:hypothetical protein
LQRFPARSNRIRQFGETIDRQTQGPGETAVADLLTIARVEQYERLARAGEQAVVPDAMEAVRQDVQQEAADELVGREAA